MPDDDKHYIGDSVYGTFDGFGGITLTTENGVHTDPSNTIVLDAVTLRALLRLVAEHNA